MVDKIGIHWFRLDLRLNDNPSLIYLNKQVDKIIPLFVYDENIHYTTLYNSHYYY